MHVRVYTVWAVVGRCVCVSPVSLHELVYAIRSSFSLFFARLVHEGLHYAVDRLTYIQLLFYVFITCVRNLQDSLTFHSRMSVWPAQDPWITHFHAICPCCFLILICGMDEERKWRLHLRSINDCVQHNRFAVHNCIETKQCVIMVSAGLVVRCGETVMWTN